MYREVVPLRTARAVSNLLRIIFIMPLETVLVMELMKGLMGVDLLILGCLESPRGLPVLLLGVR